MIISLVTGFGIHWFAKNIGWYVGLSGVLYGYLIYLLLNGFRLAPLISTIGLVGIISKIIWDQTPLADTQATAELIGGAVAVNAHFYGGIGGLFTGFMVLFFADPLSPTSSY